MVSKINRFSSITSREISILGEIIQNIEILSSPHNPLPRVITLDKNPAYPPAIQELINEKALPKETLIRQTKYLNNIVEQDHRFIIKIIKPMLGCRTDVKGNRGYAYD
jgi:transposase-like protein